MSEEGERDYIEMGCGCILAAFGAALFLKALVSAAIKITGCLP